MLLLKCWINFGWGQPGRALLDQPSNAISGGTSASNSIDQYDDVVPNVAVKSAGASENTLNADEANVPRQLEKKDTAPHDISTTELDNRHITLNITEYCLPFNNGLNSLSILYQEENDEWMYLPNTYDEGKTTYNQVDVRGASGHPFVIGPCKSTLIPKTVKWREC